MRWSRPVFVFAIVSLLVACDPSPPTSCEGVSCSGHGTCALSDGVASCTCEPGYEARGIECVAPMGDASVPPPTCDGVTCSGRGTCALDSGTPTCTCDDGYRAVGLSCVADSGMVDLRDLFPTVPPSGVVNVTLHPGASVTAGSPTRVALGVPFPRGAVMDAASVSVLDATGVEIPARVEELTRWRTLGTGSVDSLRAALVFADVTFEAVAPMAISIAYGNARTMELGGSETATSTWVPMQDGPLPEEYPASEAILEPSVFATFEPDWLSACLLRSRFTPTGADARLAYFDEFYVGASATAVNDVSTTEPIDYLTSRAPWLFDRAMTLFGTYMRTGDVRWLRHAHRAAQYFANHIDDGGTFDLAPDDTKYAYGEAILLDMVLTGDARMLPIIERVAGAQTDWNETYTRAAGFWTERHQTYSLLGALSAWEATGSETHAARVRAIADATFEHALSPPAPYAADGCVVHELVDHEGGGGEEPVCSPWMSALLSEAVFRYYLHSEDERALIFLANLGDYVRLHGTYDATAAGEPLGIENAIVPYYLSSSAYNEGGPWGDMEHTCDVAGLTARAAWARQALGGDPASLVTTRDQLLRTCEYTLDYWHRPGSDRAEWRLSPPRKFNWWFGTTLDLGWMVAAIE